jgi:serine/threonine-protein kinase
VAYAIEIGRALTAAHAERLVHRDVKPQNVLIDAEGRGKVTDFGIARSLEAHGLTATGRVLGTTDYVSPEQALGEGVGPQSDIYSLGICLYEMLAGEVPFRADSQVAVAMKHVREPMPDIQRLRPEISADLARIVERATAKETRNRYTSAAQMVSDLEHALAIEATRSGETGGEATTVLRALPSDTADFVPARVREPRKAVITSMLIVAVAAGLIAYFSTRTESGPGPAAIPKAGGGGLKQVRLASSAAHDYDPESTDKHESPDQTQNAIDGSTTTNWNTETYREGLAGVQKDGVGLYLDARRLDLVTSTPGFAAVIFATDKVPDSIRGWTPVSARTTVRETQQIKLNTVRKKYRYYLLWIEALPDQNRASVQEIALRD